MNWWENAELGWALLACGLAWAVLAGAAWYAARCVAEKLETTDDNKGG